MRSLILLLQSLGIALAVALFIGLLTGELRHQRLLLEWPQLIEADSQPLLEIILLALPSMLLFVLLGHFVRARAARYVGFVLLGELAAFFAVQVFAQAFGATWTVAEISELLLAHLHLLVLALLPGLLLIGASDLIAARRNAPPGRSPLP